MSLHINLKGGKKQIYSKKEKNLNQKDEKIAHYSIFYYLLIQIYLLPKCSLCAFVFQQLLADMQM